jgi:NADH:ubiquinone oxidoreductase subunit 4 (subunit M)
MNLGDFNILTMILFSPAAVALILALLPSKEKVLLRWGALLGSLIPLGLSIVLWFSFQKGVEGFAEP